MRSTYRHQIDFGESLAWSPPAGAAEFFLWAKVDAEDAAMRWRRLAGRNIATGSAVQIPETPAHPTVRLTGAEISLAWDVLLTLFDGYDAEILQVTSHDAAGALLRRDVFSLPPPTSVDAATIAAQERRVLKKLLERREVSTLGIVKLSSADGSALEREPIAVLDRRIADVRARIAWFEAASMGDPLPRLEVW